MSPTRKDPVRVSNRKGQKAAKVIQVAFCPLKGIFATYSLSRHSFFYTKKALTMLCGSSPIVSCRHCLRDALTVPQYCGLKKELEAGFSMWSAWRRWKDNWKKRHRHGIRTVVEEITVCADRVYAERYEPVSIRLWYRLHGIECVDLVIYFSVSWGCMQRLSGTWAR